LPPRRTEAAPRRAPRRARGEGRARPPGRPSISCSRILLVSRRRTGCVRVLCFSLRQRERAGRGGFRGD
jgi:hypothetical protein